MNLVRCKNGHFYDADKSSSCPHCNEGTIDPVNDNNDFWRQMAGNFPPEEDEIGIAFSGEKEITIKELKNKTVFEFVPQEVNVYKNKAKLKCCFDYSGCKSDDYMYIIGLPYKYDIKTLVINTFGVSYDSLSHFEYNDKEDLDDAINKEIHDYEKELEYYQTQKQALLSFIESSVKKYDSMNDCFSEWEKCKSQYDETSKKIEEYLCLINELNKKKREKGKYYRGIKIKLNSDAENVEGRFELEIIVSSITWQPEYVIEIGNKEEVNIKLRGLIDSNYQSYIRGAKVSLSTGIETGMNAKKADKYILKKGRIPSPPLPMMNAASSNSDDDYKTLRFEVNENDNFYPSAPNIIENEEKSDDYSGSRTYSIESSFDIIPGDVSEVIINRWTIPVRKRYIAISSKNSCASMIMSTEDFKELLNRNTKVRLYYNGEYSGRDTSDNLINNASIVFGQVRDIKVYKDIEISKKDKVPFKKTIREHQKYKITIKNETSRDVDIYVVDNIPTSFDEDIAIDVINADGAKLDKETGIANWDISVQNGASKEITVEYTVTYPEGVMIDRTR